MKVDIKRLARQEIGVNKWMEIKQGTLHYFTGVGKTYTAILIMKALFRIDNVHSIVILVPSEALQKQWNDTLEKLLPKYRLKQINVFTGNYILTNDIRVKTNTLIVDELHKFYGEQSMELINGSYIDYDNTLGLTATYYDPDKREKQISSIFPIIDEITEEEAINEGYITPFVEFNLAVVLTQQEANKYEYLSKKIGNLLPKFGRNGLDLATKCISGGIHNDGRKYKGINFCYAWAMHNGWKQDLNLNLPHENQINEIWNPHKIMNYAVQLMGTIRKRKELLYNCEAKLEVSKEILLKFPEFKSIVFSESTAFADKLHLVLNKEEKDTAVIYHSKLPTTMLPSPKTGKLIKFGKTRLKKRAMELYSKNKARVMVACSSLDEGFDDQEIVLGLTASGNSNFNKYQQRNGRVKRNNTFNPNKKAILINLYVKDTQEEKWLTKRQSKSNHKVYEVSTIDDISLNPIDNDIITKEQII